MKVNILHRMKVNQNLKDILKKLLKFIIRLINHQILMFMFKGTNVSKTGKLKPSTEYCYLNNFHNFWKWLHEKYNYVIYVDPPEKICKSFTELKQKIIVLQLFLID